jgi:hypothetical protein
MGCPPLSPCRVDGAIQYYLFVAEGTWANRTQITDAQFAEWVAAVKAGNGTSINPKDVQKTILDQAEFESLRDGNRGKHQIEVLISKAKSKKSLINGKNL